MIQRAYWDRGRLARTERGARKILGVARSGRDACAPGKTFELLGDERKTKKRRRAAALQRLERRRDRRV